MKKLSEKEQCVLFDKMGADEIEKGIYTLLSATNHQCLIAHREYEAHGFLCCDSDDVEIEHSKRLPFVSTEEFCEYEGLAITKEQVRRLDEALNAWCMTYQMMILQDINGEFLYPESLLLAWKAGDFQLAGLVVRDDYKVRSKKTRSR